MLRYLFIAALVLGSMHTTFAGHLCAGEMRYTHIAGLTYSIEVRVYLDSFQPPDAPTTILSYGDGTSDTLPAQTDLSLASECCDRLRTFVGEHTYSDPGIYTPSYSVFNRTPGIVNIPSSVDVPICISGMLLVSAGLTNSAPEFLNHAVFSYYNGPILTHELQPFDADGDSLSFELVEPAGPDGDPIAGYLFPNEVGSPGPYTIHVNANGVVQWDAPQIVGLYVLAIRCTEWREGEMIGSVTRDMMLCVNPGFTGIPPEIPPSFGIEQTSFDGAVSIRTDNAFAVLDVVDARGTALHRLPSPGSRTTLLTGGMAPGVYIVRMIDDHGTITTGRFIVAR